MQSSDAGLFRDRWGRHGVDWNRRLSIQPTSRLPIQSLCARRWRFRLREQPGSCGRAIGRLLRPHIDDPRFLFSGDSWNQRFNPDGWSPQWPPLPHGHPPLLIACRCWSGAQARTGSVCRRPSPIRHDPHTRTLGESPASIPCLLRARSGSGSERVRKIGIVAPARKLLIATGRHQAVLDEILEERVVSSRGDRNRRGVEQEHGRFSIVRLTHAPFGQAGQRTSRKS